MVFALCLYNTENSNQLLSRTPRPSTGRECLTQRCMSCSGEEVTDAYISLKVDNTAAMGAINNMGSKAAMCDGVIVKEILQWAAFGQAHLQIFFLLER